MEEMGPSTRAYCVETRPKKVLSRKDFPARSWDMGRSEYHGGPRPVLDAGTAGERPRAKDLQSIAEGTLQRVEAGTEAAAHVEHVGGPLLEALEVGKGAGDAPGLNGS